MITCKKSKRPGIAASTKLDKRMVELRQIFALVPGKFEFNKEINGIFYYVVGVWEELGYPLKIGVADWKRIWSKDPTVGHGEDGIWPIIMREVCTRTYPPKAQAEYIKHCVIRILDHDDQITRWHRRLADEEHQKKILPRPKRKTKRGDNRNPKTGSNPKSNQNALRKPKRWKPKA